MCDQAFERCVTFANSSPMLSHSSHITHHSSPSIDPLHSQLQGVSMANRIKPIKVSKPIADAPLPLDRGPTVHTTVKLVQGAALDQPVVEIEMRVAAHCFQCSPTRFRNNATSVSGLAIVGPVLTSEDVVASDIEATETRVLHHG